MGTITKQKCNNCLKVHSIKVDICDACGGTTFTPFSDKEKVHTIGDVVRAQEAKLTKEAAEDVIKDSGFKTEGGIALEVTNESLKEAAGEKAVKEAEKEIAKEAEKAEEETSEEASKEEAEEAPVEEAPEKEKEATKEVKTDDKKKDKKKK